MIHDVTKLPQWAQDKITQAEQTAEYWRTKLKFAERGETDVFIRRFGVPDIGLPPESMISFMVANMPHEDSVLANKYAGRFDVQLGEDQRLEVTGVGAWGLSDQVRVIPRSSNLFYVELTPWNKA